MAIGVIALVLTVRHFVVPADFGVHGKSFTYNFFRLGNIDDWKAFPVKYRGKMYCAECHEEEAEANLASYHKIIECENCHGPAAGHPDDPEKLVIDSSRNLCLRCHSFLPYPSSQRADIRGINPLEHNPDSECRECHNPHNPDLEQM